MNIDARLTIWDDQIVNQISVTHVTHDMNVSTCYITLNNPNPVHSTTEVSPDLIYVDLDIHGKPVGVELLEKPYHFLVVDIRRLWDNFPSIAPQVTKAMILHAFAEDGDDVSA